MISLILTLLKSKYPAVIWTIIIFVLCTIPGREAAKIFTWSDKISHLLAFAGFTFFWLSHTPRVFFILISGILYGTLIELWQSVLSESFQRGFSYLDIAADAFGCLIGYIIYLIFSRLIVIIEKKSDNS